MGREDSMADEPKQPPDPTMVGDELEAGPAGSYEVRGADASLAIGREVAAEAGEYRITGAGSVEGKTVSTGIATEVDSAGEVTFRIYTPLPAAHPFYAVIGQVASEWSHLEHILDMMIWDLADIPGHVGACITSQIMGSYSRFKCIVTLSYKARLSPALIKRVETLMQQSAETQEARNRIVHDPWYLEKVTGVSAQFRSVPYKGREYGHKEIDELEIDALLASIRRKISASP